VSDSNRKATTWRKLLAKEMEHGETAIALLVGNELRHGSEAWQSPELDARFFVHLPWQAVPFMLWTDRSVYYGVGYDNLASVESVPRTPTAFWIGMAGC